MIIVVIDMSIARVEGVGCPDASHSFSRGSECVHSCLDYPLNAIVDLRFRIPSRILFQGPHDLRRRQSRAEGEHGT